MKNFFLTYGCNKFEKSKERLISEAKRLDFFDDIRAYSPKDLSSDFIARTSPYIQESRGGGYWLWKAFLLKETFALMNMGDFCMYADAGCHLVPSKGHLEKMKDQLSTYESGIVSIYSGHQEKVWTNAKVIEFFELDHNDPSLNTGQIYATCLIFIKTVQSQDLVDKFYEIATNYPSLFSDEFNDYNRKEYLNDHRHDQSILSLLRKKNYYTLNYIYPNIPIQFHHTRG